MNNLNNADTGVRMTKKTSDIRMLELILPMILENFIQEAAIIALILLPAAAPISSRVAAQSRISLLQIMNAISMAAARTALVFWTSVSFIESFSK